MPKDKGPHPAPAPTGHRPFSVELRQKRQAYLEKTRERKVEGFKTSYVKHINLLDDKQIGVINARYGFETSRDGFKNYSKGDLKSVQAIPKQDHVSFDYMSANHFNKYQLPEKSSAAEKENIEVWSERYQNQIDFHRDRHALPASLGLNEPEVDEPEPNFE